MTQVLSSKMIVALSLCILLTAGAWVPLVTTDSWNTTTDTEPAWEVRTLGTRESGDGTKDNPFLIYTVDDLQAMKDNLTAHYALANDIDASATEEWNGGTGFEPVGDDEDRFTGSLDGRNYTITGLFIDRPSSNYVGQFGSIGPGGLVINVGLLVVDSTGQDYVGGLVGINDGSVSNCYVTGSVSGTDSVGGLVGFNRGRIENCHSGGNVSSDWNVGGLVGQNIGGSISNCSATGSVSGGGTVSGLVGANSGPVENCYATGSVSGNDYLGGLVGRNYVSISNCYASGMVSGTGDYVGGLVGSNGDYWARGGPVENCYATGNVTGEKDVGGFVGWNNQGSVENCHATGHVTRPSGTSEVLGGFVGHNYQGRIITCYSTGSVHYTGVPDPTDKGFCGAVDTGSGYEMTGNFWDTETSLQNSTAGEATGKTTAEMQTKSTFTSAHWNFDDLWCMIDDIMYPLFRWQDTEPPVANAGPDHTVDEGAQVIFDGSASTDNIGIVSHTWTFHDGTGDVTLYGVAPGHTFTVPGMYIVTLTVTDVAGRNDTDSLTVIVDSTPPTAQAGSDQTVDEGAQVTFDGSASTDDVGIVNYTWTFHDGIADRTRYGVAPSHTFTVPGTYTVTLTVTDTAGHPDTDTMVVTVTETVLVPEVIFDTVTLSPERPKDGDTVTLTVTLKNTGNSAAQSVTAVVGINGDVVKLLPLGVIPADGTATGEYTWTARKGTYTLEVDLTYTGGQDSYNRTFEVGKKSSDSPGFEVVGALAAVGVAVVVVGTVRKKRG